MIPHNKTISSKNDHDSPSLSRTSTRTNFNTFFSCFFCLLGGFAGWRWFDWALKRSLQLSRENAPFDTECEIMARARLNMAPTDEVADVDVVVVDGDIEEVHKEP